MPTQNPNELSTTIVVQTIFFSIYAALCLSAAVYLFYCWYRAAVARFFWKDAQGTIEELSISSTEDTDGVVSFCPKLTYSYDVNGHRYIGKRLMYDSDSSYSEDFLWETGIEDWEVGTKVALKYSPKNPAESVIFARPSPGLVITFFFLILCSALFLSGVIPTVGHVVADWLRVLDACRELEVKIKAQEILWGYLQETMQEP